MRCQGYDAGGVRARHLDPARGSDRFAHNIIEDFLIYFSFSLSTFGARIHAFSRMREKRSGQARAAFRKVASSAPHVGKRWQGGETRGARSRFFPLLPSLSCGIPPGTWPLVDLHSDDKINHIAIAGPVPSIPDPERTQGVPFPCPRQSPPPPPCREAPRSPPPASAAGSATPEPTPPEPTPPPPPGPGRCGSGTGASPRSWPSAGRSCPPPAVAVWRT